MPVMRTSSIVRVSARIPPIVVSAPRGRAPVKLGVGRKRNRPPETLRRHSRGGDALDQVCFCEAEDVGRGLGHTPARARRTKAAPLATEGQQQLLLARITAKPQKAMGQDAALQVVVKFTLDIGRQTFGVGIGADRGEKDFNIFGDHFVEYRMARITWFVGGNSRRHVCTLRTALRAW